MARYAGGLTPEEIRRLMRETDWDAMFESDSPFEDKTFRRKQDRRLYPSALEFGLKHGFSMAAGLNSGQQVAFLLDRVTLPYWDIESFDQLPTPFRSVAVDLRTSTVVVLGDGSLSQALRATMSLPAVFGPVEIGPWLLVDGGVLNNVPADVVRDLGAAAVVAVRVGEDTSAEEESPAPSILSLAARTINTMETASERIGLAAADLVIEPDLEGFDSLSWRRSDELADRGYQAAEAMSARLLPYAVSEEEYAAYVAERRRRIRTTLPIPTRLEVVGATPADAALVRTELAQERRAARSIPPRSRKGSCASRAPTASRPSATASADRAGSSRSSSRSSRRATGRRSCRCRSTSTTWTAGHWRRR